MEFKTFIFKVNWLDDVADKITEKVREGWTFHQIISVNDIDHRHTVFNVLMSK